MNLLVSIDYPPIGSGQGKYVNEIFKRGDYSLITTKKKDRLKTNTIYETDKDYFHLFYFFFASYFVFIYNDFSQIKVIHTNGVDGFLFLLFKKKGVKYVNSVYNTHMQRKKSNKKSILRNIYYYIMIVIEKIIFERSDVIIATSQNTYDSILEYNISSRLELIDGGVDTNNYLPGKKSNDEFRFLFIGRLVPRKRCLESLVFFHRFLDIYDGELKLHLDIIGSGSEYDDIVNYIVNHDLENFVQLHGHVDELIPFYKKSDALILLSLGEGIPLVILESISSGIGIIATKDGIGNTEWILDYPKSYICDNNLPSINVLSCFKEAVQKKNTLVDLRPFNSKLDRDNVAMKIQEVYK